MTRASTGSTGTSSTGTSSTGTSRTGTRTGTGKTDGRHARRERGRFAAIDAAFELILEGHIPPAAEDVAERAGISMSSLFRYFDGIGDMQRQALDRFADRYLHLLAGRDGDGGLPVRIARFVELRVQLFTEAGPLIVLAQRRAIDQPLMDERMLALRTRMARQARSWFGPELAGVAAPDDEHLVGLINSIASPQGFDIMTRVHECDPQQIADAWERALRALIDAWSPHP